MTTPVGIGESELHAYLDGELDPLARAEVEAWLRDHPEDAARLASWRDQKAALHAAFDPVLAEPLPPALRAATSGGTRPWRAPWLRVAAALVLFVAGGATGWALRGIPDAPATPPPAADAGLVRQAVGAHLVYVGEVRHPVEVRADEEAHLVAWLSNRLGGRVKAPKLESKGFQLVGGRLLPDGGTPAAQFMYEDQNRRRVTLYVRRGSDGGETAFRFASEADVSAFYWIDGPFGYALAGKMPRDDLLALARVVHQQLDR